MKVFFFRSIGISSLLMAAGTSFLLVRELSTGGMAQGVLVSFIVRLSAVILLLALIGIGSLCLRKWAGVYASAFYGYVGVRFLYSFESMPPGRVWLVVLVAVLFFIPFLVTVKYWNELKPGGRWYF